MLTRAHERLLDAAVSIGLDAPTPEDKAFMARQMVQATLPHRNPGDMPLWSRTNGDLVLTIQPGHEKGKLLGFPYGTIPRLLMFWATTEAIRTKSRRLELGRSLNDFMRAVGLDPDTGGGKRGMLSGYGSR